MFLFKIFRNAEWIILLWTGAAMADVRPAALFTDHMVLQRDVPTPVWGFADPGERVRVMLGPQKKTAIADSGGRWMVRLDRMDAGGPFEMTVTGKNTVTVQDILVGEVWLCSGQSNMDMTVAREDRYWCGVNNEAEEVAAADYPLIREFRVRLNMKDEPQKDVEAQWSVCSPATVGKFSATAYFFARELFKMFRVPIGLVVSTFGASTAQAWTSRPALSAEPGFDFLLKTYDEACAKFDTGRVAKEKFFQDLEKWKGIADQARAEGKPVPRRPRNVDPHQDQHNPCVLYNGMIAPLVPYAVRGALWYQGESNYPTGKIYFDLMKTLIADWRSAWHQDDFPFLFVQLANNKKPAADPNEKSEMAPVREGQFKTLRLEDTGMAVSIDIGDADNIHPKNKQEIGRRLGLVARALVYGEQSVYSGPLFRKVKIKGHTVRVSFRHTEGGLTAKGDTLKGFAIAGPGGKFFWADAKIDGKVVVVSSPDVPEPVAVRYGWADNPTVNLYNGAGLPASPFRTDGW